GGQTYAQLSAKALAQPANTALAGQVQTMFRGETLRGLLLNAYGWWQIGQIMLVSAIVAFSAAGLFLILSGLGFWHLRRGPPRTRDLPAGGPPGQGDHLPRPPTPTAPLAHRPRRGARSALPRDFGPSLT